MHEEYFYIVMMPTAKSLSYVYSKVLKIAYNSSGDLNSKQSDLEKEFRTYNGNPANYNSQWSAGAEDSTSANHSRKDEIAALKNAGKVVKESNWPEVYSA